MFSGSTGQPGDHTEASPQLPGPFKQKERIVYSTYWQWVLFYKPNASGDSNIFKNCSFVWQQLRKLYSRLKEYEIEFFPFLLIVNDLGK